MPRKHLVTLFKKYRILRRCLLPLSVLFFVANQWRASKYSSSYSITLLFCFTIFIHGGARCEIPSAIPPSHNLTRRIKSVSDSNVLVYYVSLLINLLSGANFVESSMFLFAAFIVFSIGIGICGFGPCVLVVGQARYI